MRSSTHGGILLARQRWVILVVLPREVAGTLVAATADATIIVLDNIILVRVREVFIEDLHWQVHQVRVHAARP